MDEHLMLIRRLIEEGANVNAGDFFNQHMTPLHYCSNAEIARLLIEAGADVNVRDKYGLSPLHRCKDPEIARLLIAGKANVNAVDDDGRTPLHLCDNLELARLLIKEGANVNARDYYGQTPLHLCSNPEIALLLIEKGADVNARDNHGETPLHECWEREIALLLIEKGADVNARDNHGETPLRYCMDREVAGLLIGRGAATIGVTNNNEDINALIQSKATELLTGLTKLPNDIQQLTTQQKAFITHLTAPKRVGNPLQPLAQLNGKSLVDYMREDKPNLLQFAWEYHEDKIFNGVANPIEFNHSLQVMALSTIIKNISEKSELDIDDRNTLRANYENIKSYMFLSNGSNFKQQQQQQTAATTIQSLIRGHLAKNELNKAKTAATKIQALGRGHIVRQRNIVDPSIIRPEPQRLRRKRPFDAI